MTESGREPGRRWLRRGLVVAGVVLLVGAGVLIAFPGIFKPPCRCGRSRVKANLRSMATAIEGYYVDHLAYPAWSTSTGQNAFGVWSVRRHDERFNIPSFATAGPGGTFALNLTTPVAYISRYMRDPFAAHRSLTFAYWRLESTFNGEVQSVGFIAWSPGPDRDYDLTIDNVAQAYNLDFASAPGLWRSNPLLLNLTYDPTNGAQSNGDIWRTKQ